MSSERNSSQLDSACQETQVNTAVPAWHWDSHFFTSIFLLPVSPCSWLSLVDVLPLADWGWLAPLACLEHCPQVGCLHRMEVLSSNLVRLSETGYKPGMLEMSMNQEKWKYSSLRKAKWNRNYSLSSSGASLPWMLETFQGPKRHAPWGITILCTTPSRCSFLLYTF